MRDPQSHPVAARLRAWADPALAAAVEVEFRAPIVRAYGRWRVCDRFLIRSTLFSFDVRRWSDVLWAFRRGARWLSHPFVQRDHAAVLVSRDGQVQLEHDREGAEVIVQMAARRVPWAAIGDSKEVRREAMENWEGFVSRIESRRQEMERENARRVS